MADGEPVLDMAVLEGLLDLDRGGQLSLQELVEVYEEDGRIRIAAMRQANEERNAGELELQAHALKGSSRNFGAAVLSEVLQEVEVAGAAATCDGVPALLDRIETEFRRVLGALSACLDGKEPKEVGSEEGGGGPDGGCKLEMEALEDLRSLEEFGDFSLQEVVDIFIDEGEPRISAMRQALDASNGPDLRRESHTLKASARDLGATALAEICQEVEDLGQASSFEDVSDLIDQIAAEFNSACEALRAYMAGQKQ